MTPSCSSHPRRPRADLRPVCVFQAGECRYNPAYRAANCSQFRFVPQGDEGALQAAVATIGPISVAIDALRPSFTFYHSGGCLC